MQLAFFTFVNILNYLDRYLVHATLPLIIAEMSLNHEQGGRLVAAFVFGYFIFSPLFGYLGDRFDRPRLMAFGVFAWSVATIATGLTKSYEAFFLARMFVGVGEASFGTIAPGYIKDRVKNEIRVNNALATFFVAIPVGAALGFLVAGLVAGAYSWRMVFFVGGVPGLLLAPFFLRLKELRQEQPRERISFTAFYTMLKIPILWFTILGYILNTFALQGIAAFVSKYGISIGFSLEEIDQSFSIILVITGILGTLLGGRLASSIAAKSSTPLSAMLRFVSILSLLGTPCVFVIFLVSQHTLFLLFCFLAELFIFAALAPVNSILVLSAPPRTVTAVQGITIFLINLFGALLGPIVVGKLADTYNLSAALQVCTVALFLSGIIWGVGAMSKFRAREIATR